MLWSKDCMMEIYILLGWGSTSIPQQPIYRLWMGLKIIYVKLNSFCILIKYLAQIGNFIIPITSYANKCTIVKRALWESRMTTKVCNMNQMLYNVFVPNWLRTECHSFQNLKFFDILKFCVLSDCENNEENNLKFYFLIKTWQKFRPLEASCELFSSP